MRVVLRRLPRAFSNITTYSWASRSVISGDASTCRNTRSPPALFGKDQVVDGKLVRGGNRADELEHTFRFFLRGFDVYGNIGGGYDFVRDVLNHAGYVVCGVEAQGWRGLRP